MRKTNHEKQEHQKYEPTAKKKKLAHSSLIFNKSYLPRSVPPTMTRIEIPFSFAFRSFDHSQPSSSLVGRPTLPSSQKMDIKEKKKSEKETKRFGRGRVVVNKVPFIPAPPFPEKIDHKIGSATENFQYNI